MFEFEKEKGTAPATDVLNVPVELLGYRASPETIGALNLSAIKRVATHVSPAVAALIRDIETDEDLEACLCNAPEEAEDIAFWDALSTVLFFTDRNARVELLVQRGVPFLAEEQKVDYVVRCLIDHPKVFQAALEAWIRDSGEEVGGRSYTVFGSMRAVQESTRMLRSIDGRKLVADLRAYFEKQGYGTHCDLIPVDAKGKRGFIIDRCGYQDTKTVMSPEKKKKKRFDRDFLRDYVFFHDESNCLWVYAKSGKDAKYYADRIAEFAGDPLLFGQQDSYNLLAVQSADFVHALAGVQQDLAKKVVLKAVRIRDPDENSSKTVSTKRHEHCLMARENKDFASPRYEVKKVVVGVNVGQDREKIGAVEFTGGKIKIAEGITVEEVVALAGKLGIKKPYTNA